MYLKDQNNTRLLLVLAANVFVFWIVANWPEVSFEGTLDRRTWLQMLPVGLGLAIIAIVNGLVPSNMKAQMVFWRVSHPLPSSRVFSELAKTDARVNLHAVEKKYGLLPVDKGAQSQLWYRCYRDVENDPVILGSHKDYLFARDCASLSLLMLLPFGIGGWVVVDDGAVFTLYMVFLLLHYFVVRLAAEHYGNRFATNVLARSSDGNVVGNSR